MGAGREKHESTRRVFVAVSESMARLRRTQGVLNGFWQTSDLAYGYMLGRAAAEFPDLAKRTVELLGDIESQVWYPSSQGRIKREASMEASLQQVRENNAHVYRATLVSFSSAFELYLDERVAPLRNSGRWGPYAASLAIPELREAETPVRPRTILCADFCRRIRNRIVHQAFAELASLSSQEVAEWKRTLCEQARSAGWPAHAADDAVGFAAREVIGRAEYSVETARREGKKLPIEYFYMLFTFTNLDSLAFEIEEALQGRGDRAGERVSRKADAVRRADLITDVLGAAGATA